MPKPVAAISVLCCATSRFSSAVMPANSRMFWKVRADAGAGDAVAGQAVQVDRQLARMRCSRMAPPLGR